jgi:hypothetical protein
VACLWRTVSSAMWRSPVRQSNDVDGLRRDGLRRGKVVSKAHVHHRGVTPSSRTCGCRREGTDDEAECEARGVKLPNLPAWYAAGMPASTFPGKINTYNFYSLLVYERGPIDGPTLEKLGALVAPGYTLHPKRVAQFRSEIRNEGSWAFAGGKVIAADDANDEVGPLRLRWVQAGR